MRSLILCAKCYLIFAFGMGATTAVVLVLGRDNIYEAGLLLASPAAALIVCAAFMYRCVKRLSRRRLASGDEPDPEIQDRLADAYLSTVRSLVAAIDSKDSYTKAHTSRVMDMAVSVAKQMRLSALEIQGIETAALVHDIGKIGIPEHILKKPGKLTPEEFQTVKEHTIIGSQLLEPVDFPWPIQAVVRGHQEKWDGSGYPDGIRGKDIPLGARILAVADVFDALTSNRSYRNRLTPEQAAEYISRLSGSHFDPAVVKAFLAVSGGQEHVQEQAPEPAEPEVPVEMPQEIVRASSPVDPNRELYALSEITRVISSSLDPREIVSLITSKICPVLEADACVIFMREDPESPTLSAGGIYGINSRFFTGATVSIDDGATGDVVRTGKPYCGAYPKSDVTLIADTSEWVELQSCAIIPITRGDNTFGTINVYRREAREFDSEDMSLLKLLASRSAVALERALIRMRSEKNAPTDSLTGLMNPACFMQTLERNLSGQDNKPVSVLSISLDNFKMVNETLGHHSGDRLLQTVARLIRDTVGTSNPSARYGGDIFTVMLPGADREAARKMAERIDECFATYSSVSRIPRMCKIGISTGSASSPEDGTTAAELLAVAESRQQEMKNLKKLREVAA